MRTKKAHCLTGARHESFENMKGTRALCQHRTYLAARHALAVSARTNIHQNWHGPRTHSVSLVPVSGSGRGSMRPTGIGAHVKGVAAARTANERITAARSRKSPTRDERVPGIRAVNIIKPNGLARVCVRDPSPRCVTNQAQSRRASSPFFVCPSTFL